MIRLRDLRHAACRTTLVWAVACLLVAQALLPVQLHTRFMLDTEGDVVQICTLQGVKTVVVDPLTGDEQVLSHEDEGRSPACAFSQLLTEALASAAVILPGWLALATVAADPLPPRATSAPALRHSPIRAPPALV